MEKLWTAFPREYCVLDVETTGLDPSRDEVVEIAAVRYSSDQEVRRFQSLLRPAVLTGGRLISMESELLTGITEDMLVDAPESAAVLCSFLDFAGDLPVLGYNVSFDLSFLREGGRRYLGRPYDPDTLDVLRLARKLYRLERYRLKDMLALFGLTNERAHRALTDVYATADVYVKLKEEALRQFRHEAVFFASLEETDPVSPAAEEPAASWEQQSFF